MTGRNTTKYRFSELKQSLKSYFILEEFQQIAFEDAHAARQALGPEEDNGTSKRLHKLFV